MDSYPAHKLLTGREITRHRLRGLQASKELQRLNRRTSEGLMSTESLSSILQKFDLNGDGDDRKMAKEFVSALRSLNAAPAAGQRSMSALSSPDIRSIIQTISSPEKRPGHAPNAKSPDVKSKGAVDYHRLSRCRSFVEEHPLLASLGVGAADDQAAGAKRSASSAGAPTTAAVALPGGGAPAA